MVNPVYARLRMGGTLYNDANWSVGIAFCSPSGGDPFGNLSTVSAQSALETWVDNLQDNLVQDLGSQLTDWISQSGRLKFVRASRVGTDGRETAVADLQLGFPINGTQQAVNAAQAAVVLSLQSGRPGASYRGRVYWPALGAPLTSGRLNGANCLQGAQGLAGFLTAAGSAAQGFGGTGGVVAGVVSTRRNLISPVTSVRVGNRLDTQRRRAEGEQEVYSVAPVAQ